MKIGQFIFNKGSLLERFNKTIPNNTGCTFINSDKGKIVHFDATDDLNGYGVYNGVKTIVFWIKPTADTKLFQDNGTDRIEISGTAISGTGLTENYVFINSESDTDTVTLNRWQCIIAEFSGGIDFSTDFEIDVTAITDIGYIELHDSLLSAVERGNIYKAYNRASNIGTSLTNFNDYSVNVNSNEYGLVSLWGFAGDTANKSLDQKSGTTETVNGNPMLYKEGLKLNGITDYITVADRADLSFGDGSNDSPCSFEFYGRIDDATNFRIFGKGNDESDGEYTFGTNNADKIGLALIDDNEDAYRGGYYDTALTDGLKYHILITYDGRGGTDAVDGMAIYINGISVSVSETTAGDYTAMESTAYDAYVGQFNSKYVDGIISFVKVYDRELSASEVRKKWNKIANHVLFFDDFRYNPCDGILRTPDGWVNSAYMVVAESDGTHLPLGKKYITNTSAINDGFASFVWTEVNCMYSFSFVKTMDLGNGGLIFNADMSNLQTVQTGSGTGYGIYLNTEERIVFSKYLAGGGNTSIQTTAAGYFALNTKYDIRVLRLNSGITKVWIKGGVYTSWTLAIDVAAETTYTASQYAGFISEVQVNDIYFTDIKITRGLEI